MQFQGILAPLMYYLEMISLRMKIKLPMAQCPKLLIPLAVLLHLNMNVILF
ncbi:hypothetical protein D3C72_2175730 [compost metagenome]